MLSIGLFWAHYPTYNFMKSYYISTQSTHSNSLHSEDSNTMIILSMFLMHTSYFDTCSHHIRKYMLRFMLCRLWNEFMSKEKLLQLLLVSKSFFSTNPLKWKGRTFMKPTQPFLSSTAHVLYNAIPDRPLLKHSYNR